MVAKSHESHEPPRMVYIYYIYIHHICTYTHLGHAGFLSSTVGWLICTVSVTPWLQNPEGPNTSSFRKHVPEAMIDMVFEPKDLSSRVCEHPASGGWVATLPKQAAAQGFQKPLIKE